MRSALLAALGVLAVIVAFAYLFTWRETIAPRANALYGLPVAGPGWSFSGPWATAGNGEGQFRYSGQAGARAELLFEGSRIDLTTYRGPSGGYLRVWIDGSDARADLADKLPSGQTRIDLYDPSPGFVTIPIASSLPDGPHTLTLEVAGRGNDASIGQLVRLGAALAGDEPPRWPQGIGLAGLAAGIALTVLAPLGYLVGALGWRGLIDRWRLGDWRALLVTAIVLALVATMPSQGTGDPLLWIRLGGLVALAAVGALAPWALATVAAAGFLVAPSAPPLASLQLNPGELGLLSLTGAWALRAAWLDRIELGIPKGWLAAVALFVVAAIVATAAAEYSRLAWRGFRLLVAEPVWMFILLVTYVSGRRRVMLAWAIAAAAAIAGLHALVDGGLDLLAGSSVRRLQGIWSSPNSLAFVLERGLPVLVAAFIIATIPWRRRALAIATTVVALTLAATLSRGGLVGATAGLATLDWRLPLWSRWRPGKYWPLLAAGGLAAALGGAAMLGWGGASIAVRASLWGSAMLMAKDHLILGVGPDNFLYHLPEYLDPAMWREPNLAHPHNLILDAWLSFGLAGLLLLALLIFRAAGRLLADAKGRPRALRIVDFSILAGLAAGLVHGAIDNFYSEPALAAAVWIVIAYAATIKAGADPDHPAAAVNAT